MMLLLGSAARAQSNHEDGHRHPTSASASQHCEDQAAGLRIPASLAAEHEELHAHLEEAVRVGGKTGEAARKVADILHAHFVAENRIALPPLGLLKATAEGTADGSAIDQAIRLADELRREYPKMLEEHQEIKKALADLELAATSESRPEQREFARKLALHAEMEETVLYPATLLLGEFLKTHRHKH